MFWFCLVFFCFKQKTAYEMRISDWSSDVCSSDLWRRRLPAAALSMLLAVALTLAGAVHALPPQGSATPSSDSISRAEAFVPWICGPGKIGRASCRERVCQYV